MDLLKRANRWATNHPIEFAAIQTAIGVLIQLVMGGHPSKSTEYVKKEISKISRKYDVPEKYVELWIKQALKEKHIYYVSLG